MAEAEQELQADGDDKEGGAYDGVVKGKTEAAPPGQKQLHQ